ncbi:MAG: cell division ATP-binding protein FtsE [bacterium]|nr:cell division ATP-binding protein FtsE [bacterium]
MIKLDKVSKKFPTGTIGLSEISFSIEKGEFVFLVGPTGSGKTTIFRLLIRDTLPSEGTIIVGDLDIVKLPHHKIPHLRKTIGVVFQDLKLLMDRTIFENIYLPLDVAGIKLEEAQKRVEEIMEQIGIAEHKDKFPIQLSGGELQRVAIARSLILSPDVLLADEPTGNLDPTTSKEIVKLLTEINKKGTTVVMATHNEAIVNTMSKRVLSLEKGKLLKDEKKGKYVIS